MTLSGDNLERYEDFERGILERLPIEARHVPRSETAKYDAILLEPAVSKGPLVVDSGRISIDAGTETELKTCKKWIKDAGSPKNRRRGQYKINEATHSNLVEIGGVYIFVVLDSDSGRILAARAISAEDLPEINFHRSGKKYSSNRAAISWASVIPLEEVDP